MTKDERITTLAILLAGYLARERETSKQAWDRSQVLACWPLSALGVDWDPAGARSDD